MWRCAVANRRVVEHLVPGAAPAIITPAAKPKTGGRLGTPMRTVALAVLLLLAGCADPAPVEEPEEPMPPAEPVGLQEAKYVNFTGTLRSLPVLPDEEAGDLEVLPNTGRITATLLWTDPLAELSFHLDGPGTGGHDGGHYTAPGDGRAEADIPEPSVGDWTFRVVGENAMDVAWTLVVFMAPDDAVTTVLAERYLLPRGSFFEINTEMELNATMNWEWSITDGSDSDFNIHTHFDDEVQYIVRETTSGHEGNVTADRAGGYSLMWENPGAAPQTIDYRVWGQFTVHSYFPPR